MKGRDLDPETKRKLKQAMRREAKRREKLTAVIGDARKGMRRYERSGNRR